MPHSVAKTNKTKSPPLSQIYSISPSELYNLFTIYLQLMCVGLWWSHGRCLFSLELTNVVFYICAHNYTHREVKNDS